MLVAKRHGDVGVPAAMQEFSQRRSLLRVLAQARVPQIVEVEAWSPRLLPRGPPRAVQSTLGDTHTAAIGEDRSSAL